MDFLGPKSGNKLDAVMMNEQQWEQHGGVPEKRRLKAFRALYGFGELAEAYELTCVRLRGRQPLAEQRTQYEQRLLKKLRHETRLQLFPSFWIGRSCFDLFIPAVQGGVGSKMRGLVIELDGPVHLFESKMRKDETRGKMLRDLGIAHVGFDNVDLNHELPQELIKTLKSLRRLDHRGRQRLLSNVYAWTVLVNEKYLPEGHHDSF